MSHTELSHEEVVALKKAARASFIGNFVEWFDYASYGYLAVVIAQVFFPADGENLHLLETFAIFALSFVLRPIGAIFWGNWGDKWGRRWALSWSILLMSGASFLIGVLPGYYSIGMAAPIALLLLRMVQGFSASGEYSGAGTFLAEYAPPAKRGLYTSLVPASTAAGLLVGSLMVTGMHFLLSNEQMLTWGWRIPFLMAGPLGLIGRYIRVHLEDSPVYEDMKSSLRAKNEVTVSTTPVRDVFRYNFKEVAITFGVACLNAVGFYMLLSYMPTYLSEELKIDTNQSFLASTICLSVYMASIFVMGHLSDTFGRKRMLITACVAFIVLTVPLFKLLDHHNFALVVGVLVLFGILLTINDGTLAGFIAETFPTKVRYTGFALSFNMANVIFGGTAPFISTWLIKKTGSTMAPAWYMVVIAILSLGAMLASTERKNKSLDDI